MTWINSAQPGGAAESPSSRYILPSFEERTALGIAGYGFAPLRLPADLDFTGMFHGVDERVPIDSLVFGQSVLTDLLRTY